MWEILLIEYTMSNTNQNLLRGYYNNNDTTDDKLEKRNNT